MESSLKALIFEVSGRCGPRQKSMKCGPSVYSLKISSAFSSTNGKNLTIPDMTAREVALFVPLIACSSWIGIYPKPSFDILRQPVAEIVERVRPGYYGGAVQNAAQPLPAQGAPRRGSDQSPERQRAGSSVVAVRSHAGGVQ